MTGPSSASLPWSNLAWAYHLLRFKGELGDWSVMREGQLEVQVAWVDGLHGQVLIGRHHGNGRHVAW